MTDSHSHSAATVNAHGADPHLAHHFETARQQLASSKLGMWIFLCTEILMFGGLFCVYAVYRHNHPDVFVFAHQYLDKTLGAINTIVLITSSLTMAWGVRLAQLNNRRGLVVCLALTILGGACFMGIKSIEYEHKWKEGVWIGFSNKYSPGYKGSEEEASAPALPAKDSPPRPQSKIENQKSKILTDPNAGTPDEPKITPPASPRGLLPHLRAKPHELTYQQLAQTDQKRVATFFSIYFLMTGLHGLHVLIGMGLITWVLIRAARGAFSSQYFTPVDLVGLYWHLVDMIWIFLFPLLYLIH